MIMLNIAGGVALILFGIRFLRKGLDRLMGHGLHGWLERMTRSSWKTLVAGATFGTIAPSSTAQTLLTLQLLDAGKLSAERMLARTSSSSSVRRSTGLASATKWGCSLVKVSVMTVASPVYRGSSPGRARGDTSGR